MNKEKVRQFLLTVGVLNLKAIAEKMWPNNKAAGIYLYKKLKDEADTRFTENDARLAMTVLQELAQKIKDLQK